MDRNIRKLTIILAFSLFSSCGYAAICTPEQADKTQDEAKTWSDINQYFIQYHQCDEGYISEGVSDGIAHLFINHWDTLPDLNNLIKQNPSLKKFVINHIDTTLNESDVEKIGKLASVSCPQGLASLCKDIKKEVQQINAEFRKPAN